MHSSRKSGVHIRLHQEQVLHAEEFASRVQAHLSVYAQSVQVLLPYASNPPPTSKDLNVILSECFRRLQSQYARSISLADSSGLVILSANSELRGLPLSRLLKKEASTEVDAFQSAKPFGFCRKTSRPAERGMA